MTDCNFNNYRSKWNISNMSSLIQSTRFILNWLTIWSLLMTSENLVHKIRPITLCKENLTIWDTEVTNFKQFNHFRHGYLESLVLPVLPVSWSASRSTFKCGVNFSQVKLDSVKHTGQPGTFNFKIIVQTDGLTDDWFVFVDFDARTDVILNPDLLATKFGS